MCSKSFNWIDESAYLSEFVIKGKAWKKYVSQLCNTIFLYFFLYQQSKYGVLKRHAEKIEMEMTQMHLWQAQAMEGIDEDFGDGRFLSYIGCVSWCFSVVYFVE